jgi:hypothetical protein
MLNFETVELIFAFIIAASILAFSLTLRGLLVLLLLSVASIIWLSVKDPLDPRIVVILGVLALSVIACGAVSYFWDAIRLVRHVGCIKMSFYLAWAAVLTAVPAGLIWLSIYTIPNTYQTALWEGCDPASSWITTHIPYSSVTGAYGITVDETSFYGRKDGETNYFSVRAEDDGTSRPYRGLYARICGPNVKSSSASNEDNVLKTIDLLEEHLKGMIIGRVKLAGDDALQTVSEQTDLVQLVTFGPSGADRRKCNYRLDPGKCLDERAGILPLLLPIQLQPPKCRGWFRSPSKCLQRRILKPFNAYYEHERDELEYAFLLRQDGSKLRAAGGANNANDIAHWFVDAQLARVTDDTKWWVSLWFLIGKALAILSFVWLGLAITKIFFRLLSKLVFSQQNGQALIQFEKKDDGQPLIEICSLSQIGSANVQTRDRNWHYFAAGFTIDPLGSWSIMRCLEVLGKKLKIPNRLVTYKLPKSIDDFNISSVNTNRFSEIFLPPGAKCIVTLDNVTAFSDEVTFSTYWHWGLASTLLGGVRHVMASTTKNGGYIIISTIGTNMDIFPKPAGSKIKRNSCLVAFDVAAKIEVDAKNSNIQAYWTSINFLPLSDTPAILVHDIKQQRTLWSRISNFFVRILLPL